jgi:Leucine-rich repeat (LRR) protein
LENLITLNLSDNNIQKIEGLSCCTQLQTLELENNLIGVDGVEDVIHLLDLQTLTTLILTNNRLEEESNF